MRPLLSLLAAAALAAPWAARGDPGFALDARAGLARPFGDASNGDPLADLVGVAFPLELDGRLTLPHRLSVGAYVRFAPATLGATAASACSGMSCSVSVLGLGVLGEWRVEEGRAGGPWIGASFGYERLAADASFRGASGTVTRAGPALGLQAGFDFELERFTLGPWAGLGAGEFTRYVVEAGGAAIEPSTERTLHGWLELGARATLSF